MKILQSSIFRAVTMIVVGVLLVKYREDTMRWLTIVIGLLFFISGLISVCFYLYEKQRLKNATPLFDAEGNEVGQRTPMFSFVGVGSMILGVILAMMSTSFIIGVTYTLAAILIIGAINQFVNLIMARSFASMHWIFWLLPFLTLGIGILIVVHPMETAALPLQIIGLCMMYYGVVECINGVTIFLKRKKHIREEEASIVQGTPVESAITKQTDDDIEDAVIVEE
jgi:uncharacterized membrane protein HdeD (DUF308 family)